jgi:hypothetical protein
MRLFGTCFAQFRGNHIPMKFNPKFIAAAGLLAALVTLGSSSVRADDPDEQAFATVGSPNGGGNSNPSGGAAWDSSVGNGGFNFHNGPIIGDWDDFADFGSLVFNATFQNTSFDNTGSISTNYIQPWGVDSNTATYGQTFVDPAGAGNLLSFSFFLQGGNDGPISFQAFAMTWDGSLIGGQPHDESNATILYASQPINYTPNGASLGSGDWQEITVNIPQGGLALTGGDDYLIGLSTLGVDQLVPTGPGSSVPDAASTLALLGVAFGGLVVFRRRLQLA